MSTAISAVAKVAFLASDVVVDSLPAPPAAPAFSPTYHTLTSTSPHRPKLVPVPSGADPADIICRNAHLGLISLTAVSDTQVLTRLLLKITDIAAFPVVLHVAIKDDLSDVLLLRSAVPFFLLSTTPQQAHDNALLSSRLARLERKPVVHAFYATGRAESLPVQIPEETVLPFLLSEKPQLNGPVQNGIISIDNAIFLRSYHSVALETVSLIRRPLTPLEIEGSPEPHTVILTVGKVNALPLVDGVSFVSISLLAPLPLPQLLDAIPTSATRVVVLENIQKWSMKWLPVYLDVVSELQQREPRPAVQSGVLNALEAISSSDILALLERASSSISPVARLYLGPVPDSERPPSELPHVPKHESAYTKILSHVFKDRLEISNSPSLILTQGKIATSPEFALGRVRGQLEQRNDLVNAVHELLLEDIDGHLHSLLTKWVRAKDDPFKRKDIGIQIVEVLQSSNVAHPSASRILSLRDHFHPVSRWIIGSDAWSYDLGASGLHHAIASGLNVNILILDTLPYSARNSTDPHRRKHDVGLYAMNHGHVYVASVAVYSSYSQVLQSVIEADRFDGPSIVLAYLPYQSEDVPALEILKETKLAVDAGYWPLYRWDPSKECEGKEPFSLDSDAVKNDLRQFLDRQNHLSQLTRAKPQIATELVNSLGENVKEARRQKAKQAYNDLLSSLDAPPLLVLYASDGGAAEKIAKRLANRGKARGLSTTIATLDSFTLDDLAKEEQHVALITSTAGQGEPPQNGRTFSKALNAAIACGDKIFSTLRYAVFGMGDSHYWPRPEDAHYYNKPGKDLDARIEKLGGERVVALGLGDDQDEDGPQTGYKIWEPLLWKALGVDAIEVTEAEPEPITNEHIKAASGYLRGTITEGLEDLSTGALAPSDTQLTKFHGIYQQDDRDIRDERQAQGVEPAYSFMIRVRMPGGVCKPRQWLQMDQIADEHGSGTFKITTRQTFQFHGVIKRHLKSAIQDINRVLLDTLAACGDVNRYLSLTENPHDRCSRILQIETLCAHRYQVCPSCTTMSTSFPKTSANTSSPARPLITKFGWTRNLWLATP